MPSVYVHAPYCRRRCFYCDFAVDVRRTLKPERWLSAISEEWKAVAREDRFRPSRPLDTLYVGGGTPSLLGPEAMSGLARILGPEVMGHRDRGWEWTAEANPESFTREVARGWRRAGVNRVSLGVQSFHGPTLRWMGRLHGPDGSVEAVDRAREAGISNVSVDLMFGLGARIGRPWRADLDRVIDLELPHVSIYGLAVEKGTPLERAVSAGKESVAGEERYREEFLEASERMTKAGYLHYEVSNFALPGKESRHNRVYWSRMPYLGLGNSSHSYLHPYRRWNLRDWTVYRRAVEAGGLPLGGEEVLDRRAARLEELWLALRTSAGIAANRLPEEGRARVAAWIREGLALRSKGRIRLTPTGWLLLDRFALELSETTAGAAPGARG